MALAKAQQRLREEFERAHGYWHPMWEPILEHVPEQFEAYLRFSAVPHRNNALPPKIREFILIAVNAAMTHMYEPAVRAHIANALRLGATREELQEVLGLVTILGIHTVSYALPILLDELKVQDRPVSMDLSPRAIEVRNAWVEKRGYWPVAFTPMLALDPEFVAAFSGFGEAMRTNGPLDRKTIELIYLAVDGSATHMFENGVRVHGLAAIRHGATLAEVMATLELASVTGMHGMTFGLPILNEEIAKLEREGQ
jgi:alkylhydroperoxidase/carboxymuconolactone decarboxylase family protein YurZ